MTVTLEPRVRPQAPDDEGALVNTQVEPGPVAPPEVSAAEIPALVIDHVTKRFVVGRKKKPVLAIDDVSMRIKRGEIYGVLGANGSGKSTLIRLVSTLLTIDEGHVEVFGLDITKHEMQVKRYINRVSVDAAFFKKLSPAENLSYAARLYGVDPKWAAEEAVRILARLGVKKSRLSRPVEQMSRGMQQKVAIARALLRSPVLLLLDEPTTGLDPRSKLEVQAFIRTLRERHDSTILLCTHDMAEAEALADRVGILHQGTLLCLAPPAEIRARYGAA